MAKTKPSMKYKVINGVNPKTGAVILRPLITNRETINTDQLISYALTNNYVVGQYEEVKGSLSGCLEAAKVLGQNGAVVTIDTLLRIHPELTGTVGADRQLDSAKNELVVRIQTLKELKNDINNFSWTNIEDTDSLVKLESICSDDGKAGVILKDKDITVGGKRISFDAAWGDTANITYDGLATPIALTPTSKAENYLRFAWPAALSEVEEGTVLTFSFTFHGKAGGKEQPQELRAVYKVA